MECLGRPSSLGLLSLLGWVRFLGTSYNSGIRLMFCVAGLVVFLVSMAAFAVPAIRALDEASQ